MHYIYDVCLWCLWLNDVYDFAWFFILKKVYEIISDGSFSLI